MKKNITIITLLVLALLIGINVFNKKEYYNVKLEELRQQYSKKPVSPVDHAKLPVLDRPFDSPQDVTEACMSCHTERHKEILASAHWNWERVEYIRGRGIAYSGKKSVLNNYCIGSNANEQACAKCHIGFGMSSEFDFENARNVDCMVCHDNSDEYLKGSAMAGYPDRSVNLTKVAQSVGLPKKINCGSCHFYGGGGNNVKHGDLEDALASCERTVDVHMAATGINMECVACHTAENHNMKGKLYSVSSDNINRSTCEQCHTEEPHFNAVLNAHFDKVACQTCHIPIYAKVNSTKMSWNWSEAGKMKDGKPFHEEDEFGNHTYLSIKGKFTWGKNVKPDYVWFNGTADHYLLGDKVTSIPVQMNTLNGSYKDPGSKIIPVKIHRGDQLIDKQNRYLIQPKLYAAQTGDSAYWKDFDWNESSIAGMERVGLPYSGAYEFVETEMYWPVNHMVSPKEMSLECADCHRRETGRLAALAGFYLPGRDRSSVLDVLGTLLLFGSLMGVAAHACLRVVYFRKREKV
ncbi:MAG: tetrathionate reductase family octaheme c-type cytochrome [Fibrobacteria bacterium]|nr:tetrathionate reductase family octaheme c-type cytochrome [Fibrobacteria bacterium]